ncbi:MAG TPA: VOC family protein [Candidatus Nanopelagicales bacterium]|nr:VOC family protein [Candidatus Nanopelagicales bacterium]
MGWAAAAGPGPWPSRPPRAASRLAAAIAAGGRIVDDAAAPEWWVLSDRAGNRVCIASWPDGARAPDDAVDRSD